MNPIKGLKLRGNCVGPGIKRDGWRTEFSVANYNYLKSAALFFNIIVFDESDLFNSLLIYWDC